MKCNESVLDNFPKTYTPTSSQTRILDQLDEFIASTKKFAIIIAPTGSGKSFISKAVCNITDDCDESVKQLYHSYEAYLQDHTGSLRHAGVINDADSYGAFILTITKNLQDQYLEFFPDMFLYKGKSNYMCKVDEDFDVETAPCILSHELRKKCWNDDICPYYKARNVALSTQACVLNYRKFFTIPSEHKKRQFIICDEASELEEELVNMVSATIKYSQLEKCGITTPKLRTKSYTKTRKWVNSLLFELTQETIRLSSNHKKLKRSSSEKSKLRTLLHINERLSLIELNWLNCEFIIDNNAESVTFLPLRVDKLANNIFKYGEKILLTSATIIDPINYIKSLGIKEDDCMFIEEQCKFDSSKSPIYISDLNNLNYKNKHTVLPKLAELVKKILKFHKDEKGIIHTHSNEISSYLQNKLTSKRLLFRDVENDNNAILKKHEVPDSPTVLVSPSLGYGVDLKDDLARFQIVMKVPYPPLGNKRINHKFKTDKQWFENRTLSSLVQMCGRATRSKDDYAVTYILDGNAIRLIQTNRDKLPDYFIDRIE